MSSDGISNECSRTVHNKILFFALLINNLSDWNLTHIFKNATLEQKSQHQACKIYKLIHVLLAHVMVLAVSCRPPNTELWVLFLASACHLWWTKCQWHGHFSLYVGTPPALSLHEGSILIFHSSATNTIPTQQLAAMLNRTLFLSCDFHLWGKFKSNQFTCLVECPGNRKSCNVTIYQSAQVMK